MFPKITLAIALAFALPHAAFADDNVPDFDPHPLIRSESESDLLKRVPPALASDVSSPEAIVKAFHESVSGPKGDWDNKRLRSLCIPNIYLAYIQSRNGVSRLNVISLDALSGDLTNLHKHVAWYEKTGALHVTKFGGQGGKGSWAVIPHTVSEGTSAVSASDPAAPSTSTTQVVKIGSRWWIVSHVWNGDD